MSSPDPSCATVWRPGTAGTAAVVLIGGLAIAGSARVEVPMVPVPMTLQTLAVLVVGGLFGTVRAGLTVAAYLVAGGLGLPVFAGGAAGWAHLVGSTGGYLFGFLVCDLVVGRLAETGWLFCGLARAVVAMVVGSLVILGLGAAWLSVSNGWAVAWEHGLRPFALGAFVKSVVAAAAVTLFARRPSFQLT